MHGSSVWGGCGHELTAAASVLAVAWHGTRLCSLATKQLPSPLLVFAPLPVTQAQQGAGAMRPVAMASQQAPPGMMARPAGGAMHGGAPSAMPGMPMAAQGMSMMGQPQMQQGGAYGVGPGGAVAQGHHQQQHHLMAHQQMQHAPQQHPHMHGP